MNAPIAPVEVTRAERAARQAEVVRALQTVLPVHTLLSHCSGRRKTPCLTNATG